MAVRRRRPNVLPLTPPQDLPPAIVRALWPELREVPEPELDQQDLEQPPITGTQLDRRIAYGRRIGLLSPTKLTAPTLKALEVFDPGQLFELLTLGDDVVLPENWKWDTTGSPLVVEPGPRAKTREVKQWDKDRNRLLACYDALRWATDFVPMLMSDEDARGVEQLAKNWRTAIAVLGRRIGEEKRRADHAARSKRKRPRTAIRRRNLGLLKHGLNCGAKDLAALVLAAEHDWVVCPCRELVDDHKPDDDDDDDLLDATARLAKTFENDLAHTRRATPRKKRAIRARH